MKIFKCLVVGNKINLIVFRLDFNPKLAKKYKIETFNENDFVLFCKIKKPVQNKNWF